MVDCEVAERVIRTLRERSRTGAQGHAQWHPACPVRLPRLATGLIHKGGPHDLAECLKTSYGLAKYRDVGAPRLAPRVFRGAVAARRGPKRLQKTLSLHTWGETLRNQPIMIKHNIPNILGESWIRSHDCPRAPLDRFLKKSMHSGVFLERPPHEQRPEATI